MFTHDIRAQMHLISVILAFLLELKLILQFLIRKTQINERTWNLWPTFTRKYVLSGEIYTTGKTFTLPPAVTGVTNIISGCKPRPGYDADKRKDCDLCKSYFAKVQTALADIWPLSCALHYGSINSIKDLKYLKI